MEFGVEEVFETAGMILFEHFDIRAVTLGVNLKDLVDRDAGRLAQDAGERLAGLGKRLVGEAVELSESMGLPIINKRLSITPAAWLIEPCAQADAPLVLAQALDRAACEAGVDFIGGFGALVQKGTTAADRRVMESLPQVLSSTQRLCGFLNLASTLAGMNMDAIVRLGHILKDMAAAGPNGIACAKFVAFCNAPEDNPFMAGAFHGGGEADAALNVGISGPGVVRAVVDKHPDADLTALSEIIRRTVFKITRGGELVGRELARRLGVPFGVVDISLAPTTAMGDSVGRILEGMGLERVGAPGTTAALALLIDAVKKGGAMASGRVGGLSGTFIPVSEDEAMIEAVEVGALSLEKLEAMTAVCSVGLDMFAVPGDTSAATLSAIIADELSIGMANDKTTGVRVIPAPGTVAGDSVDFGGLLGRAPVMPVNRFSGAAFVARGGRMPAPVRSLRN
ncbi:MAG: PFL family protein [Desulfarculus sp.]|nr:PFL family protein [Pseudomonadota bacterium]MBU4597698.1 PFL family protein [Pseudomonadota bacterium]MBV1716570.1 PFL family protein [Desulfarculus sp.]MBV1736776.1 PFL family protein [Desulfarculus sp.]